VIGAASFRAIFPSMELAHHCAIFVKPMKPFLKASVWWRDVCRENEGAAGNAQTIGMTSN
jgi:hypothetical protein